MFLRWGVPTASAELYGETLPGVWRLGRKQAQLHNHLQWLCESQGCWNKRGCLIAVAVLLVSRRLTSADLDETPRSIRSYRSDVLLCRSACWRNTWSSSSLWRSPASTWTTSQSCSCKALTSLRPLCFSYYCWPPGGTTEHSCGGLDQRVDCPSNFPGRTKMRCQVTSLTCCWPSPTSSHSRRCSWTTDVWVFCERKHNWMKLIPVLFCFV